MCSKCKQPKLRSEFYRDRGKADGLTVWCKDCNKAAALAWNKNNPEKRRRKMATWKQGNRGHVKAYKISRRSIEAAWMRAKRRANPDIRARDREYLRIWLARPGNRARFYERTAARRARKLAATVGVVDYAAILVRDGRFCWLCGYPISADLTFDHVIPLIKGGAHSMENVRPAHRSCNSRKNVRLVEEIQGVLITEV